MYNIVYSLNDFDLFSYDSCFWGMTGFTLVDVGSHWSNLHMVQGIPHHEDIFFDLQ